MKKWNIAICCVLCCILSLISCFDMGQVSAEGEDLQIDAKSSLLMDFDSGTILYEDNADEKVPVASIVKLMTVLITMEEIEAGNLSLDEKLTTTENASGMGGSQVFIDPYVEYTVDEMLKSVIVASANDASVALAEKIAGSEQTFVSRMNKRAQELGLKDTIYVNASGLPEPNQYSTARDVAKLFREVIKHKLYFEYSTIWMDNLTHPSGRKTEVVNTNKLIRYFKGCDAGKTGSTDEAGYCLVATAEKGNMRLISVVLGATTSTARFNESSKLLNYGFSNFENKQIIDVCESVGEIKLLKSKTESVKAYASDNYYVITRKGEHSSYEISLEMIDKLKAPVHKGDKVGEIKIIKDGAVVDALDVVILEDIETIRYSDSLKEIISRW